MNQLQTQTMADGQPFPQAFQHFWFAGPGAFLLNALRESGNMNCTAVAGWAKGGCLVWAEGVMRWAMHTAPAAGLEISLVTVQTDETEAAHVLVALRKAKKLLYVDATGAWTPQELERRLAREYRYDGYALVPWKAVMVDRVSIPFDVRIAQQLETALTRVFGPFSPEHMVPTHGVLDARKRKPGLTHDTTSADAIAV